MLTKEEILKQTQATIRYFDSNASSYLKIVRDRDARRGREAFLSHLPQDKKGSILDFGCGPGLDLLYFKEKGFSVVGLDGSKELCRMARELLEAEILEQNFITFDLKERKFDGIFANASLFHIPRQELSKILKRLLSHLNPNGILFASIPIGDLEDWNGESYGNYMPLSVFEERLSESGFQTLESFRYQMGDTWEAQDWGAVIAKEDLEFPLNTP